MINNTINVRVIRQPVKTISIPKSKSLPVKKKKNRKEKHRLKVKTTEGSIFRKTDISYLPWKQYFHDDRAMRKKKNLDSSVKQAANKQGQWNRNGHWLRAASSSIDRHRPETHQLVEFVPLLADGGGGRISISTPLRARVRLSSNGSAMLEISCDTAVEYRYSLPAFPDSSRTTSKNVIRDGLHSPAEHAHALLRYLPDKTRNSTILPLVESKRMFDRLPIFRSRFNWISLRFEMKTIGQ